jgi:hypothetical protein
VHVDELLGEAVDLDFYFFSRSVVEAELVASGFTIEWSIERAPYVPFEYPSRRAYVLTRCPTPTNKEYDR